jgi:hypothetical protein
MIHPNKMHYARAIGMSFAVGSLLVAWQAVRFLQGEIGAPMTSLIWNTMSSMFSGAAVYDPGSLNLAYWYQKVMVKVIGAGEWIMWAAVLAQIGNNFAGYIELGPEQYRAEKQKAERLAEVDRARQNRLALAAEAQHKARAKRGLSNLDLMLVGSFSVLIGAMVF